MRLRASHVLAEGVGTSDVVRAMWKLSRVYPAQPSLGLPNSSSETQKPVFRQTNIEMVCVYTQVSTFVTVLSF